ncbi:MAG: efflux RND transporter permease subunit [Pseudomonadota bacterium]
MNGAIGYFVRHRTIANLVFVVMLVGGLIALDRLRAQFFPDVVIETVTVSVVWPGAGAEDVDRGIVAVIEPVLIAVDGVDKITSVATEGRAYVSADFEPGTDMSRATDDVKAAIDTISILPDNAEDPKVQRAAWRDLVTFVAVTGPVGNDQLVRMADELIARLFRAGVTRTAVQGVSDPRITVSLTEAAMIRHDVTLAEIAAAISAEAEADPAGDVTGSGNRVRSGVEKRSAEEIGAIALRVNADGTRLLIRDVAQIEVEGMQARTAFYIGDQAAVTVRVERSDAGDAIGIQNTVERVVAEMQPTLPEGASMSLIRARAEAISGRLDLLIGNGALGLAMVLVLLFLFLDARTAFWVAAGIPAAMLAALGLMWAAGLTINMVSLFALILTLGIVVDDAIVVGEYTDQLHRYHGHPPAEAARLGALRMTGPVLASTITTIIAFASLTLVGGRMGSLIADIPFTVSVVLLASLVECFLVLPHHMHHALLASAKESWIDMPSRIFNRGFDWFRRRIFAPCTEWVIRLRYPVLAGCVALLAWTVSLFYSGELRFVFFNAPEEGNVIGNFAMLPGATREDSLAMMRELQRAVIAVSAEFEAEDGTNPLTFAMGRVGSNAGRGLSASDAKDGDLLGAIEIELIDPDLRSWTSATFVARLEEEIQRHPLLETMSFRRGRFGPGGNDLEVRLYGDDAKVLKAAAEDLKAQLAKFDIVTEPEDSQAYDKTELVLELTPQGEALGLDIETIGTELYRRLSGMDAAEFPVGLRTGTIRVMMAESEITADFLSRTRIATGSGSYVALSDVVTITASDGFATVRRENGQRVVTVTADVEEGNADASARFRATMEEEVLPALAERWGIRIDQGGLAEQEDEFLSDALIGLIACLIGIYAALAWVFASWWRPVVVMLIIPFGLIGAFWGHVWWGVPLSMFSIVGLLGMTGIIVNDSIVLISTIDEAARRRALIPALVEATSRRLRPVVLTTLTTVLGMAPLLYEPSVQAQFLKPTVITIVFGLAFGMLLVLVLVPAVVAIQADLGKYWRGLRRGLTARHASLRAVRRRLQLAGAAIAGCGLLTVGWFAATGSAAPAVASLGRALAPGAGAGAQAYLLFALATVAIVGLTALSGPRRAAKP